MTDPTDDTTLAIRLLNDALRSQLADGMTANLASGRLFLTHGIASRGWPFVNRAIAAVRDFTAFTPENDPYGEHDCALFDIDGVRCMFKIDYYDRAMEMGSPEPADPALTTRVLTILLADEY